MPQFLIEVKELVREVDDLYGIPCDPEKKEVNIRRLRRILKGAKDPISGFRVGKFKITRIKNKEVI